MNSLTITRNGQITLPKKFRDKYGLREGMKLPFAETPEGLLIKRNDPSFWDNVPRCLPDNFEEMLKDMRMASDKRMEELLKRYERPT